MASYSPAQDCPPPPYSEKSDFTHQLADLQLNPPLKITGDTSFLPTAAPSAPPLQQLQQHPPPPQQYPFSFSQHHPYPPPQEYKLLLPSGNPGYQQPLTSGYPGHQAPPTSTYPAPQPQQPPPPQSQNAVQTDTSLGYNVMDAFKAGNVVQLISRSTGYPLMAKHGYVSGNGNFLSSDSEFTVVIPKTAFSDVVVLQNLYWAGLHVAIRNNRVCTGKGGKFCCFQVYVHEDNSISLESVRFNGQYVAIAPNGSPFPCTNSSDSQAQFLVRIERQNYPYTQTIMTPFGRPSIANQLRDRSIIQLYLKATGTYLSINEDGYIMPTGDYGDKHTFFELVDRGMGVVSLNSFLYPGFRLRMNNYVLEGKGDPTLAADWRLKESMDGTVQFESVVFSGSYLCIESAQALQKDLNIFLLGGEFYPSAPLPEQYPPQQHPASPPSGYSVMDAFKEGNVVQLIPHSTGYPLTIKNGNISGNGSFGTIESTFKVIVPDTSNPTVIRLQNLIWVGLHIAIKSHKVHVTKGDEDSLLRVKVQPDNSVALEGLHSPKEYVAIGTNGAPLKRVMELRRETQFSVRVERQKCRYFPPLQTPFGRLSIANQLRDGSVIQLYLKSTNTYLSINSNGVILNSTNPGDKDTFFRLVDRGMGIVSLHSHLYPECKLRMNGNALEGKGVSTLAADWHLKENMDGSVQFESVVSPGLCVGINSPQGLQKDLSISLINNAWSEVISRMNTFWEMIT